MSTIAECWIYSEGDATRSQDAWIKVAGTTYYLAAPTRFRAAMATWGGLQAAGYSLAYSATTRRVTISKAGPVFALELGQGTAALLGYYATSYVGANTYTGDRLPAGIAELVAADVYPMADGARVDLRSFRHARSLAAGWGNTQLFDVRLVFHGGDLGTVIPDSTAGDIAGYLLGGKLRIERGDATAYSEDNPDGYLDGWCVGIKSVTQSDTLGSWVDVQLTLAVDMTETMPTAIAGVRLFDAVRWGWQVNWLLLIEGLPVAFVERATGLALPSGWTSEDASLVVDDGGDIGSQVDRSRGIGAGLSLSWALLESAAVKALMASPAHSAYLTQTETAAAATLHVDSTTGWPATGALYIGLERVTYTGTPGPPATTFTGCTRGVNGKAYEQRVGKAGSIVTDTPHWWLGRDVRLYAVPVDPGGLGRANAATILTDAEMVWRGRIEGGPQRQVHRWDFSAASIDRVLDKPLVAKQSGVVVDVTPRYLLGPKAAWQVQVAISDAAGAKTTYVFVMHPFDAAGAATWYTGAEIRALVVTAWAAAVIEAGAGAIFGALEWHKFSTTWRASTVLLAQGGGVAWTVASYDAEGYITGRGWDPNNVNEWIYVTRSLSDSSLPWASSPVSHLSCEIKDGDASDVPSSGILLVADKSYPYTSATQAGNTILFAGVALGTSSAPVEAGTAIEIRHVAFGTVADVARKILCSSGTAALRSATYDTLARGEGYGLEEALVNVDSFVGQPPGLVGLNLNVAVAGQAMADALCGVYALGQTAIVARRIADGGSATPAVKLHVVDTHASGSDYQAEITDADLLALRDEPVTSAERSPVPNEMTVTRSVAGVDGEEDRIVARDLASADALGQISEEYAVPAMSLAPLADQVPHLAAARFAGDAIAQAITLRVGPWIDVHVGDLVYLNLTHPALWDAARNTSGYLGAGRCVGRTINPRSLVATLTLLVNGAVAGSSLSPSARVASFTDTGGGIPSDVTINDPKGDYYWHFFAALQKAGAAIKCLTHRRGSAESPTANWCHVTAAAGIGTGALILTVTDWTGETCSVALATSLTLPRSADGEITTYQAQFAHDADGTYWI